MFPRACLNIVKAGFFLMKPGKSWFSQGVESVLKRNTSIMCNKKLFTRILSQSLGNSVRCSKLLIYCCAALYLVLMLKFFWNTSSPAWMLHCVNFNFYVTKREVEWPFTHVYWIYLTRRNRICEWFRMKQRIIPDTAIQLGIFIKWF